MKVSFKSFDPAERPQFTKDLNEKLVAYRKKKTAVPRRTHDPSQDAASSTNVATTPGDTRKQASVTRATSHNGPLADMGSDVEALPPPKRVCAETQGSRDEQTAAPAPDTTLGIDESTPAKRPKRADVDGAGLDTTPSAGVTPATPQSASRFSNANAWRLAQSSRKSPLPDVTVSPHGVSCTLADAGVLRKRLHERVEAQELRLITVVSAAVCDVYKHVKTSRLMKAYPAYLPKNRHKEQSDGAVEET